MIIPDFRAFQERHTSITTTMRYQSSFSHKKAGEALEAVIDF